MRASSLQLANSLWRLARAAYWAGEGLFLAMARAASRTWSDDVVEAELQADDIRETMPNLATILENVPESRFC